MIERAPHPVCVHCFMGFCMLWLTGVAHFLIARVHGVHVVFGAVVPAFGETKGSLELFPVRIHAPWA